MNFSGDLSIILDLYAAALDNILHFRNCENESFGRQQLFILWTPRTV